jgi:Na+-driven multidrug efflux pump
MALWSLTRKDSTVKLQLKHIRFDKNELLPILRVGVPSALQMGMYSIANVIIAAAVNKFGTAATTGVSIANTFDGILYNLSHAASLAVLPYVSQNIGAGNIKRATKSVWTGILLAIILAGGAGALSAIFAPQLSSLLSDDPVVIDYSCQKMVIISSTYFICGIYDIFAAALRGMGRPVVPTVATLLFMCALRFVWVYVIFPLLPTNLTFLYLVWPVGWVLSIILMSCVLFPQIKKLKKIYTEHPATT